ncbi:hypothetical protein TPHA_0A05010 [Tetrapisispora phaffii CBS 4417]|uniref:Uncharacterized protein n=1 Tax=Tetrapisispora phaffii (strain ATCC 24235 / CBS 4417 / NBRC 1672 / NRRL Y-8282 / UCD 70-5) TaxID=1071381 RepID=G8BNU8_TETPH|nr:hypothetical protein TPHA_0A05010 [Tetrapisispora phaffii CBS 4417]CCE61576.1 hypothetical protein TPHA_0A05010 [Tetrapisispora phaffii CBS 4417]
MSISVLARDSVFITPTTLHSQLHGTLTQQHSSFMTSTVSHHPTLYRRDDDDSSSSSSESSRSSTSSLCGTAKCTYPADHSYSTTVGVAVGVPVGVILVIFVVILCVLYKRKKRDEKEDNDPDFVGDAEYIPNINNKHSRFPGGKFTHGDMYNIPNSSEIGSFDLKNDYNDDVQYLASDNARSNNPFSNPSQRNLVEKSNMRVPTYVPENIDTFALRDYANNIDGPADLGAYKLASKNHSLVSLTSNAYSTSNKNSYINLSQSNGLSNAPPPSQSIGSQNYDIKRASIFTSDTDNESTHSKIMQSPVKSVLGNTTQHYGQDVSGYDIDTSKLDNTNDFTFENDYDNNRNSTILPQENLEIKDLESIELDGNGEHNVTVNSEDKVYSLETEEDENIRRLKSIYNVYLDRNNTVRQTSGNQNVLPKTSADGNLDDAEMPMPAQILNQNTNELGGNGVRESLRENGTDQELISEVPLDQEDNLQQDVSTEHVAEENNNSLPVNSEKLHRVISSIYSEVPLIDNFNENNANMASNNYNAGMNEQYNVNQQMDNGQYQNFTGTNYNNYDNYNNYGMPQQPMPAQYNHPQTHEEIAVLPTPTQLAYEQSSHSLTSFSGQSKRQLNSNRLRTRAMNGTALNPMDHPDMFYKQGSDQFSSYNQQLASHDGSGGTLHPHKLRESVVMINPHSLGAPKSFKPAGSFRSVSNNNSKANSLTTQNNPYGANQVSNSYNSRVSGLIDHLDVSQPPSVGNILPHSSSNEDLRKQLGSSQNYNIS